MFIEWLSNNYIEVSGAATGLIYLYFSIRRIIWLWPLGIITSAFYVYVFYHSKFYADMGLQVYYFFISFYGWYTWLRGRTIEGNVLIVSAGINKLALYILYTILITILLSFILIRFTDSPVPVWDAFTTAGSIIATWMLAKRILENWLFWIIVDLISIGLYLHKELYPTLVLFFVYTTMAIVGYLKWREKLSETCKKQ